LPQNTAGDATFEINPVAEEEITAEADAAADGMNSFRLELMQLLSQKRLQAAGTGSKKIFHAKFEVQKGRANQCSID
jgi:hypothetical protein